MPPLRQQTTVTEAMALDGCDFTTSKAGDECSKAHGDLLTRFPISNHKMVPGGKEGTEREGGMVIISKGRDQTLLPALLPLMASAEVTGWALV